MQAHVPQPNNLRFTAAPQAYLTKRLHERDLCHGVEGLPVTLHEFLDHWLKTAVKPKVREKTYRDYAAMLRRYIRPVRDESPPFRHLRSRLHQLPRQQCREMRVLTTEQARTFLRIASQTPQVCIFALALTTGMRPSEYLALRWQDIDWERGTVSVVRSLHKPESAQKRG